MKYCPFFVFMMLCFGPCSFGRGVYHPPKRIRIESTEETKKKLNVDGGSGVVNGLVRLASQAKTWTLWLRRLLKALRKWCNSHPPEVKLGKCFASYFNIKIPGLGRNGKVARHNDDPNEMGYPSKKFKFKGGDCEDQMKVFRENLVQEKISFFIRNFFTDIVNNFQHYRDVIYRNDIFECLWNYFWKKFWTWVDSAPDSRRF